MDPYEQRLRDEVIYLHSLWHKGPPVTNPNPNYRPHFTLHQPLNPPSFKPAFINNNGGSSVVSPTNRTVMKTKKPKKKKNKKKIVKSGWHAEVKTGGSDSCEAKWVGKVTPVEVVEVSATGWPEMKAKAVKPTGVVNGEEQTRLILNQMQFKGLDAARDFFAKKRGSSSDGDEGMDDDKDSDDGMVDDSDSDCDSGSDDDCEKSVEYEFLLNLFTDDDDLRSYYEKHYENGEFYCLVCSGIGKKIWKKYKDVAAVVQHSMAIAKTVKRRAHRAYGQVICKVLGWDITRLPTIVSSGNDNLSQSLAKLGGSKVECRDTAENSGGNEKEDSSKCKGKRSDHCSTSSLDVCTSESKIVLENVSKGEDDTANSKAEGSNKKGTTELEFSVGDLMNCSEMLKEFEAGTVQIGENKMVNEIIGLGGPDDEDGTSPNP